MTEHYSKTTQPTVFRPKAVLVDNIPSPYRIPVWSRVAADTRIDFTVIYCAKREPNRQWDLQPFEFKHITLKESFITRSGRLDPTMSRYIHNNLDVWQHLRKIKPDVVMTNGIQPTFLYAFFYALSHGCKHICVTDGTLASERGYSRFHEWARHFVFKHSNAFIGASDGSLDLFRSYKIPEGRLFKSPLCIDNERFQATWGTPKIFDLMFCGRFVDDKGPLFAIDVAEHVSARLQRPVSILFVGSGELESKMRERVTHSAMVVSTFHGFAQQSELPHLYASSRIFLFPTKGDVWGIVASEACASGLPIVATPFSGAIGEIIQNGVNAFVYDFDLDAWTNAVQQLILNELQYEDFSRNSLRLASRFNYDVASVAMLDAIFAALTY